MQIYILLVLVLALTSTAYSDFTVNPSDIEEFVGYNAQFECQFSHEDGVTIRLTWLINGTVLNKTPSHLCELRENTTSPNLNVIKSTLNIAATSDCNDTDVSCIAVWSNGSIQTTERSSLAIFNVREIEVEKVRLETFNNGTILIVWDPISVSSTTIIRRTTHYEIDIFDDRDDSKINHINYNMPNSNETSREIYAYSESNISSCTTFTAFITPIIENEFSGKRTTVVQELTRVDHYNRGNVSFVDGYGLEFTYLLSEPMPFCNFNITTVDSVDNRSISFERSRTEPGSTDVLTFIVGKEKLPHNRHYMAEIYISNKHSTIGLGMQDPISLSTFDVQNVSREASKIIISFVQNTTARGAFVVCSCINSSCFDNNTFNYNVAQLTGDTIEYHILSEDVNYSRLDSILVYDIESDGLLQQNTTDLRPASILSIQKEFSIECEEQVPFTTNNRSVSNTSVNISLSKESQHMYSIVIECNVSAANTDILGCISIIHKPANYSILVVKSIPKEISILNVPVEVDDETTDIYYVVLEWKVSGLIGSNKLTKGKLPVNEDNMTGILESTDPGVESVQSSTVTTVLAVLAAVIGISVVVIISVIIIFLMISKIEVISVARTASQAKFKRLIQVTPKSEAKVFPASEDQMIQILSLD